MKKSNKLHSFNYYFLNKHITLEKPPGYRQTVITLLINENDTENKDKYLFVQEKGGTWGLSRRGVVAQDLLENLFETLIQSLGEELGFRGIDIFDTKPQFKQVAYLFNIEKQTYDDIRSKAEEAKMRPSKGKLYHLAIMKYRGPDNLPFNPAYSKSAIRDYRWVDEEEARQLTKENLKILKVKEDFSPQSMDFHIKFWKRIHSIYKNINEIYSNKEVEQSPLFFGVY